MVPSAGPAGFLDTPRCGAWPGCPTAAPGEGAATVGNGVAVLEAVPAALAAFLAHPDQPCDAIQVGGTPTRSRRWSALAGARCVELRCRRRGCGGWSSPGVAAAARLAQTAGRAGQPPAPGDQCQATCRGPHGPGPPWPPTRFPITTTPRSALLSEPRPHTPWPIRSVDICGRRSGAMARQLYAEGPVLCGSRYRADALIAACAGGPARARPRTA
jgi:hypothetical protein